MPTILQTCGPRKPSSSGTERSLDVTDMSQTRSYDRVRRVRPARERVNQRPPSGGEVFGVDLLEELAEALDLLFLLLFLADDDGGLVEHALLGEDRGAQPGGEGDGIGGTARDGVAAAVAGELDLGVERALSKLGDHD